VVGLIRAATLLLIAQQVPVDQFGQFALAFAVVEVTRQLADFGIETVAVRAVARATDDAARVVGTAVALKGGLAVLGYATLVVVLAGPYRDTGAAEVGSILGVAVAAAAISSAMAIHFQARLRMAAFVWTSISGGVAALVLVLALVGLQAATLGWLATSLVAGEGLAATLGVAALRRERVALAFSRATARWMLASAWPLALAQVLVIAYFRVDMLVLARVVDVAEVGLFGVIVRIAEPVGMIPAAIAASLYGALSPLWGARGADATRLYRVVLAVVVAYGIVAAGVLASFAPVLLAWVVPRYVAAGPALQILAWSLVFMSANMVTTAALNSLGRHRLVTGIAGGTLIFAVLANVLLIPWLGIQGAALATVLTEAWNCTLQSLCLLRVIQRRALIPVL
jgi:O-antigen/teichoic acid export membrane protein